jgi:hypothetical protein
MIILRTATGEPLPPPELRIELVEAPDEQARIRAAFEAHDRNRQWLEAEWARLFPQARGKYVAVAHQQAHVADTAEEARAWIEAQQPPDAGAFVQHVIPYQGPRIYDNRG